MKISSKTAFENFKNFISFHETFKTKFSTHISNAIGLLSCLSACLSVSDVGALWPNGWMDQDETPGRTNMPENQFVGLGDLQ